MYILASCKECQAPQGMFTNINDLKDDIYKKKFVGIVIIALFLQLQIG